MATRLFLLAFPMSVESQNVHQQVDYRDMQEVTNESVTMECKLICTLFFDLYYILTCIGFRRLLRTMSLGSFSNLQLPVEFIHH